MRLSAAAASTSPSVSSSLPAAGMRPPGGPDEAPHAGRGSRQRLRGADRGGHGSPGGAGRGGHRSPAEEAHRGADGTSGRGEPTEETTEPPAEEAAAEPEFGKKAAISSEDDPTTTFGLTSGRYRMQWSTTDCDQVDILVQQVDGEFSYPKPSRSSFASATINDLPEGTYTIEQLDPDCAEWSVRVDWMTN